MIHLRKPICGLLAVGAMLAVVPGAPAWAQPPGAQLELVTTVPSAQGISPEWVEAIEVRDSNPDEILFATRNAGAYCGGGTPVAMWKLTRGDPVDLTLKQLLSQIQVVREVLFESSDGTLFTGGGWCGPKPPYVSMDGGETWRAATLGVHPPNSAFCYAELNGDVFVGTGYDPYESEIYRWLGNETDDWQHVMTATPRRPYFCSMAVFHGRLFAASVMWPWGSCASTTAVYVSSDGVTFSPTAGIDGCRSANVLLAVGDELLLTNHYGPDGSDVRLYRWDESLETWTDWAPYALTQSAPAPVVLNDTIFAYGQLPGDASPGVYCSADLGLMWERVVELTNPDASAFAAFGNTLYIGTNKDADGFPRIYALNTITTVPLDIKPGSCPNPLNRGSRGVLPAAILGTQDLDILEIDPSTLTLSLSDDGGGFVSPLRWSFEDVGTPFTGDPCGCHSFGADGYVDLMLKFDSEALVAALGLNDLPSSARVELKISGELFGGQPIEGRDCIILTPNRSGGK